MIIKFFVSDTCPNCPPVKEYFHTLEQPNSGLVMGNYRFCMYNHDVDLDKSQFIFYSVQSVPTIIACEEDGTEFQRMTGPFIIKQLKSFLH